MDKQQQDLKHPDIGINNVDEEEKEKSTKSSSIVEKRELDDEVTSLNKNGESNEIDKTEVASIKAEALKAVALEFDRLDLNGDGVLTKDELEPILTTPTHGLNGKMAMFLKVFDADGDGSISKEEYINIFSTLFDRNVSTFKVDG